MPIFSSPFKSLEPYPRVPTYKYLEALARRHPQREAFIWGPSGEVCTFQRLWQAAAGAAAFLQERGIGRGQGVATLTPNALEFPVAFYAILLAGATVVPLNPLLKPREVEYYLRDSGAVALFAARDLVPSVKELQPGLPNLKHIFTLEEVWEMGEGRPGPQPVAIAPEEDAACLLYSSGTTGLPKGAILTHLNIVSDLLSSRSTGLLTSDSTFVNFFPLSHAAGLLTLMNAGVSCGARQVLLPRFDAGEALELMARYKATELYAVPPALRELVGAAEARGYQPPRLRFVNTGAVPQEAEVAERAGKVFRCPVTEHIGMTECAGPMNIMVPPLALKAGSVGPPIPDLAEKVVDPETGEERWPGEVGELLLKGPMVTKGYWQNPQADLENFTQEGWFRTGDLVRFDEEGYMWWLDRKKDLIKYKGYSVAPSELEAVLLEHPCVQDACVIPKSQAEVGEVPKAFIIRRGEVTAEELLRFVEERVAPYKKIREVEFVEEIPRSSIGKLLRRVFIERERASAQAEPRQGLS